MSKILIVEDDSDSRAIYDEVFKDAGFEVNTAADGEEGLEKAKQGGYSVILLDVMLPKLDGLGLLAALKKDPPIHKNGPIILLTNLSHDPVINEGLKLGASSQITKSDITPDKLVEKVKGLINVSAGSGSGQ